MLRLKADVWPGLDCMKRTAHVMIGGFQERNKRLLCQLLDPADRTLPQWVPLRQDGGQRILVQRCAAAARTGGKRCKRKIDAAVAEPGVDIMIVAVEKLEIHLRVLLLELHHHGGQPVRGDAGERADADLAGNERMQAFRRLPQQPFLPHDLVNIGHHLLALRREACAGARALQKRQLKLRLDGGEHMADAGLRKAQLLRGLCQRLQLHCFFKSLIFFRIHTEKPLAFFTLTCYHTRIL